MFWDHYVKKKNEENFINYLTIIGGSIELIQQWWQKKKMEANKQVGRARVAIKYTLNPTRPLFTYRLSK